MSRLKQKLLLILCSVSSRQSGFFQCRRSTARRRRTASSIIWRVGTYYWSVGPLGACDGFTARLRVSGVVWCGVVCSAVEVACAGAAAGIAGPKWPLAKAVLPSAFSHGRLLLMSQPRSRRLAVDVAMPSSSKSCYAQPWAWHSSKRQHPQRMAPDHHSKNGATL